MNEHVKAWAYDCRMWYFTAVTYFDTQEWHIRAYYVNRGL